MIRLIEILAISALFARRNPAGAEFLRYFFATLGVLAWLGVALVIHLAFVVASLPAPPVPTLR